jgi:hypothetical protein
MIKPYYACKNNVLEVYSHDDGDYTHTVEYKYEYDSDGFPTKRTAEGTHRATYGDDPITYDTTITRYTYITKAKTAAAETETSGGGTQNTPDNASATDVTNDNGETTENYGEYIFEKECKVILLECIPDDNGKCLRKFKYDEQYRIVEIYQYHYFNGTTEQEHSTTTKITYADNLITAEEFYYSGSKGNTVNFAINGNTVTVKQNNSQSPITLTLNNDGYIVRKGDDNWGHTYQYQDGNLIKRDDGGIEIYNYKKYDSKKSPFYNCNSPKWLLQYLSNFEYSSKNNVLESEYVYAGEYVGYGTDTSVYEYEYDSDGFPTKETIKTFKEDTEVGKTVTYFILSYHCGT